MARSAGKGEPKKKAAPKKEGLVSRLYYRRDSTEDFKEMDVLTVKANEHSDQIIGIIRSGGREGGKTVLYIDRLIGDRRLSLGHAVKPMPSRIVLSPGFERYHIIRKNHAYELFSNGEKIGEVLTSTKEFAEPKCIKCDFYEELIFCNICLADSGDFKMDYRKSLGNSLDYLLGD